MRQPVPEEEEGVVEAMQVENDFPQEPNDLRTNEHIQQTICSRRGRSRDATTAQSEA